VIYASHMIRRYGAHRSVTVTMSAIALCLFFLPATQWLVVAVTVYFIMGSSRGVGGIAISSEMMEMVPKHFMGRVQNTFFFLSSVLQIGTALLVGEAAHREGLRYGFWLTGAMYLGAAVAAAWPVRDRARALEETAAD
jgi:MFS family permease